MSFTLDLFKSFTVTVDNNKECYRHGNEAPKTERIVVICNNHISGYQVTINLAETETLVLCDVKINGGMMFYYRALINQCIFIVYRLTVS